MRKVRGSGHGLISAQEIACFAYCPEQCRLEYGLGLLPANTVALEAGTRHHASKALAERIAGGLGVVGRALMSRRCCCSASAARVACGGIAGRQGFEIALSSGDTKTYLLGRIPGKSGRARREEALRLLAIRQARPDPLALSVSGPERMVNGWAAASGEKRIDFVCRNRLVR